MRFSIISALTLASVVAAMPREGAMMKREESSDATVQKAASAVGGNKVKDQPETSECIPPALCCSSLTTPLDHIVDPVLKLLGVDAASIVGSVGLLCDPYDASTCTEEPQCCTEANLLGGTVALGCSALKK